LRLERDLCGDLGARNGIQQGFCQSSPCAVVRIDRGTSGVDLSAVHMDLLSHILLPIVCVLVGYGCCTRTCANTAQGLGLVHLFRCLSALFVMCSPIDVAKHDHSCGISAHTGSGALRDVDHPIVGARRRCNSVRIRGLRGAPRQVLVCDL